MTDVKQKPKYRPQPITQGQDQLINFELTQQNALTNWNQNIKKHEFRSKTPQMSLHNDDDLVYSDNQNQEDLCEETLVKKYSLPNNNFNHDKILSGKTNTTAQIGQLKNLHQAPNQDEDIKSSWFISKSSRMKTDDSENRMKQNKSNCLLHNKSVFFRNNTKPECSSIIFRIKPRPDIKQLAQNAYKTDRKQQE